MCLYQLYTTGSYRRRRILAHTGGGGYCLIQEEEDTGSYRRRRILAHTGGGGYWLKYEPLDILGLVCVPQLVYQ